jgi:diguanylate cyclase (GGDEF)-like protein/PAS domain S-box-containing protein
MHASGAVTEIALLFAASGDFDTQIKRAMAIIGERLGLSNCCMLIDNEDGAASLVCEWPAGEGDSGLQNRQEEPYCSYPDWRPVVEKKELYVVDDVAAASGAVRDVIEARGACAVVLAPLRREDGSVMGFLGFDERRKARVWSEDEQDTLKAVSGIIATAYSRKLHISAERAALQKFERFFRSNPVPMAVNTVDDLRFVDVNEAFLRNFGFVWDEVIGRSGFELGLFMDNRYAMLQLHEVLRSGAIGKREVDLRRKDGSLIHGLLSADIIESHGQKFFLSVMGDITEQVKHRAALQNDLKTEQDRLAHIIEATRLGTWEWDLLTGEFIINECFAEILGYTLEELQPMDIQAWKGLVCPDDLKPAEDLLNFHFLGITDYFESELRLRHKDGSWVWIYDRGRVIKKDSEGRPLKMYGSHADITWRKKMEARIYELAIRDELTGIYNRRYIFQRLNEITSEYRRCGRNFCVSILDIDHFKDVNDTYGHQAGDFILREFARSIGASIRAYDLLGRYGGEEFIIVSVNVCSPGIAAMADRLMNIIRGRHFGYEGRDIRITFSCGIADSSELGQDRFSVEALISLADERLYAAKEKGRDRCVGPSGE